MNMCERNLGVSGRRKGVYDIEEREGRGGAGHVLYAKQALSNMLWMEGKSS